jgi:hypothetical protein
MWLTVDLHGVEIGAVPDAHSNKKISGGSPRMAGLIRMRDFLCESWHGGPDTFRDYRLRHLPTDLQWDIRGREGFTTGQKMGLLLRAADRELIALGWERDEQWASRLAEDGG